MNSVFSVKSFDDDAHRGKECLRITTHLELCSKPLRNTILRPRSLYLVKSENASPLSDPVLYRLSTLMRLNGKILASRNRFDAGSSDNVTNPDCYNGLVLDRGRM